MNYFNYFTEIEDAFIRRRGKHLLLSPLDWALIESWKEMDLPLHIALRGIEKAFDSWESKPRKRTVKSLLYCQEEVEAQFAEWKEARVGAADNTSETDSAEESQQLFSKSAVLEHLRRGRTALLEICAKRKRGTGDDFGETLARASQLLGDLEEDFSASAQPETRKLEQSLSGVERMISEAVRSAAGAERVAAVQAEVKDQLKPYRKHMEVSVYQQTLDNLLLKRLREEFGVPRLSLFYLS
ncbi:MAG TPA: hypothetical protein VLL54_09200 [Pyrinomonadaceae bacterium]|nr:hypothetical protein [Pyrinomonadaceae bacterium]